MIQLRISDHGAKQIIRRPRTALRSVVNATGQALRPAVTLLSLLLLAAPSFAADECVVLLHGLGRTSLSMRPLESQLKKSGYLVWNGSYPSREKRIEELATVVGEGVAFCRARKAAKIHFVTHSLGGILVRQYFQVHAVPEAKRVVMLGPPNHGSEITDRYRDAWWYREATGPAGQQLGTGSDSLPNRLKPVPLEIGIIAGTGGGDLFSEEFKAPNDGKVSVDSTRLAEMKDFIVLDSGHTFIMRSDEVFGQVMHFLEQGRFDKERQRPERTTP